MAPHLSADTSSSQCHGLKNMRKKARVPPLIMVTTLLPPDGVAVLGSQVKFCGDPGPVPVGGVDWS